MTVMMMMTTTTMVMMIMMMMMMTRHVTDMWPAFFVVNRLRLFQPRVFCVFPMIQEYKCNAMYVLDDFFVCRASPPIPVESRVDVQPRRRGL